MAVTGVVVAEAPAHAANQLYATVDVVDSPQPGLLHVRGWVFDDDAPAVPVPIQAYVGGTYADAGVEHHDLGVTNQPRPDVVAAYPGVGVGPNQGFDVTIEVDKYGSQPIYLYALNAAGGGGAILMNNVGDASPTAVLQITNAQPGGELQTVTSPAPGQVSVGGFAVDQSDLSQKTRVVLSGGGVTLGTLVANQKGPGFEDFPVMFHGVLSAPSGDLTVCATAINVGVGRDQSIGCKQIRVEPVVVAPPPVVVPPPSAPRITLALKAIKRKSRLRIDIGPDLDPSNYRFSVQRRADGRWRKVTLTQTLGARDVSVLDLRRGRYRVVVPRQHDLPGVRATARLKR